CGQAPLSTKIVGGINASAGAWPWQVSLHRSGSHFCGGSLINNLWVLSAAHCFSDTDPSLYMVYLGRHSQDLPNPNEVSRTVSQVIVHPSYNSNTVNNDIALLRLTSPVTFTNYIQPVCLAAEGSIFNTDTMWLTGWGDIDTNVPLPSPQILQEVDVPLVGNSMCNCVYNGSITDNMMCAGPQQGGRDTCQGDSGGPMVIKQGSAWVQAGVVSFGLGCAEPNIPGVYTRVSQYQTWIVLNVGTAGFLKFISTTPAPDENATCPTTTTLCGGPASLYQWMAYISHQGTPLCVGTLVSNQYVMTSASCFNGLLNLDGLTVTLTYVYWWDCSNNTVSTSVTNINFDNTVGNGIALLQLSSEMYEIPKLLPEMYNSIFGQGFQCSVLSFNPDLLSFQEIQTMIVECDPSETLNNVCTELVDFLQVDIGSPLICEAGGMKLQAGVWSGPSPFGVQKTNNTIFLSTIPFTNFLSNTLYSTSIFDGTDPLNPLSVTCILLLSLLGVIQALL
ncbi:hypothetical protein DNTS_003884, partial [Danionella cerebrum]